MSTKILIRTKLPAAHCRYSQRFIRYFSTKDDDNNDYPVNEHRGQQSKGVTMAFFRGRTPNNTSVGSVFSKIKDKIRGDSPNHLQQYQQKDRITEGNNASMVDKPQDNFSWSKMRAKAPHSMNSQQRSPSQKSKWSDSNIGQGSDKQKVSNPTTVFTDRFGGDEIDDTSAAFDEKIGGNDNDDL